MTPRALHEMVVSGTAPVILDVRTRTEYEAGHVPGALHLPFDEVRGCASELRAFRDTALVLYCGHGPRAWIARLVLQRQQFRHLRLMRGHMAAWRRAGLPEEAGSSGK